jgi:hypothetical protein
MRRRVERNVRVVGVASGSVAPRSVGIDDPL